MLSGIIDLKISNPFSTFWGHFGHFDECSLKVSGHDLCSMTENIIHCIGKPLRKLNPEERKKNIAKVEPDEAKRKNLLKNDRMLTKVIVSYVKRECPEKCCSFMWA